MVKCPNCGQETSGDHCQWCKYPILNGKPVTHQKVAKQAKNEAERAAKEKVKREAEEARKVEEAQKQAKREAEETRKAEEAQKQAKNEAERAAKEKAKREAEEARKVEEAQKQAKNEAERAAKEKAKREAEEAKKAEEPSSDQSAELYTGDIEIVLPPPIYPDQLKQFEETLKQIEGLNLIWRGGSADAGAIIALSAIKQIPLRSIIEKMPPVEKAEKKGEKIVVTLKAPASK